MIDKSRYVNKNGMVTSGEHQGTIGLVVEADFIRKKVEIRKKDGSYITVAWDAIDQSVDYEEEQPND